jgi:beta-ureidopropionase / N-carbamoyl-L-amino-acid hydrolase
MSALQLSNLNSATQEAFTSLLAGVYEHSPWIATAAWAQRPFKTVTSLKYALSQVVRQAGREPQLALVRAHPELAGKAMVSKSLTAESTNEQSKAGLTHCTVEEFARIGELNRSYNEKFGFPFILAVRGPRGLGLSREQIITTFARRLGHTPEFELAECLRNIDRIAEIRLNDKFGITPSQGNTVWDWAEELAQFSDPGFAEQGQLTVTYLTQAHLSAAKLLTQWMQECGFDDVFTDAVGNVVGRYKAAGQTTCTPSAAHQYLMTGSHYDTVRNGGKYDGRLGIFVPMACVVQLSASKRRLPFGIEVVGFAEEEGQRYKATFLGSGALTGDFDARWLDQTDVDGTSMRAAMLSAGLNPEHIASLRRDAKHYRAFVEVHIEQGPVLNAADMPLAAVTSINGSVRCVGQIIGLASHAGTTPMGQRGDAVTALAELALYVEQRASADGDSVATIGQLNVPGGSINVVPGRCQFSLDMRAPNDAQRDALVADIKQKLASICAKRSVQFELEESMRVSAAPSSPILQAAWEASIAALGLPVRRMPSGAGHDAMKLHEIMPQAMLFVRGGNSGISHNPLETITADDAQLCVDAMTHLLENMQ